MARPARHRIELSEEERSDLERTARAQKRPWREVQRARIVLYAAEGKTDVQIAERLDTSAKMRVGRWRRRFHEKRLEGLQDRPRAGRPRRFPPEQVTEVKAMACELPATHGAPLSRFSRAELHSLVIERGITEASASTIWRWLTEDAIRPWQRSWIFRRDPDFREKAGRALELGRRFEGRRLRPDELVISADEKSQLQALGRRHPTEPPASGRSMRSEFEYVRGGTLAYLAAWDVHHARLFDRVEPRTGIEPFGRLVSQVMGTEPHASWLNQIELYFSIVQRKALTPNDLGSLEELAERLLSFGEHYRRIAQPFDWSFTRADLNRVLDRVPDEPRLRLVA